MIVTHFESESLPELFKNTLDPSVLKEDGSLPNIKIESAGSLINNISVTDRKTTVFENIVRTDEKSIILTIASKPDSTLVALVHAGLRKDRIVFFGTSKVSKTHSDIMKTKIRNYSMREIAFEGLRDTCDAVMSSTNDMDRRLYISVNLNVLERTYSKNGSTGGMNPRELLYFLQRLSLLKNIGAVEILGVGADNIKIAAKIA